MLRMLLFAIVLSALVADVVLDQPDASAKAFKRISPSVVVIESDDPSPQCVGWRRRFARLRSQSL